MSAGAGGAEGLEEIVALIVYENKGWEVFHFDFPNCFHAQFGILDTFDALDTIE